MQIVNGKHRDHKNHIVRTVKPLPIECKIDCDRSSFGFSAVAQNVEPIFLIRCIFKKDRRNHHT